MIDFDRSQNAGRVRARPSGSRGQHLAGARHIAVPRHAARSAGLTIPPSLLAPVDEVIE